jgi:hypothetical protein
MQSSPTIALTPSVTRSPHTASKLLQINGRSDAPAHQIAKSSKQMINGFNTHNTTSLRSFDQKRASRFRYDPHKAFSFLSHFSGTITAVVFKSPLLWVNVCLYISWLAADEYLDGELHCVDPSVLAAPGALFSFFITGQLGRAIARYNQMKSKARGVGLHVKTTAIILSSGAGDRMDARLLAKVRVIVSNASAAHMLFMMSLSEDRYLDVVYPEWFESQGLPVSPSFGNTPAPDAHFHQLHQAISLLNTLARQEGDEPQVSSVGVGS